MSITRLYTVLVSISEVVRAAVQGSRSSFPHIDSAATSSIVADYLFQAAADQSDLVSMANANATLASLFLAASLSITDILSTPSETLVLPSVVTSLVPLSGAASSLAEVQTTANGIKSTSAAITEAISASSLSFSSSESTSSLGTSTPSALSTSLSSTQMSSTVTQSSAPRSSKASQSQLVSSAVSSSDRITTSTSQPTASESTRLRRRRRSQTW